MTGKSDLPRTGCPPIAVQGGVSRPAWTRNFITLRESAEMTKTKLTVNKNGSLKIEGDFEIVDSLGDAYGLQGRNLVSLCRCGRSANKPFCDGSHKGHFEHDATAFDLSPRKV